jgi:hypothetical protein
MKTRFFPAKPWSLTLWASGMLRYKITTIMGDRATQECDPSTMMAPNGKGLVSRWAPIPYEYAGGFNALNSSLARSCLLCSLNQRFWPRANNSYVITGVLQNCDLAYFRSGKSRCAVFPDIFSNAVSSCVFVI